MRRVLHAPALIWVLLFVCSSAWASDALRIRVQRPLDDDALVDEAVVRVMGELSALGFDVEVLRRRSDQADVDRPPPVLDPGTEGALIFERRGNVVLVSAWVSNANTTAFIETFDTTDASVTAEVIAVRSVEALRGVLIEPRAPEDEAGPRSEPQTTDPSALGPAPETDPTRGDTPQLDQAPQDEVDALPSAPTHWGFVTHVAPWGGFESARIGTFSIGGDVTLGRGPFYFGAAFDSLLFSGNLAADAGTASVDRQRILGVVRGQLPLAPSWQGFLQLGVGLATYTVTADAAPGFAAETREHGDVVAHAGAGLRYWFVRSFGLFLGADAAFLPTPVRVRMDQRSVGLLGAPMLQGGIGVCAGYQ